MLGFYSISYPSLVGKTSKSKSAEPINGEKMILPTKESRCKKVVASIGKIEEAIVDEVELHCERSRK